MSDHGLSICLINPRFEPSFWGYDYTLGLYPNGVCCNMVTGALPALAGLLDRRHNIEILDENVETIDFDSLRRFDVIGVTGMIVQRQRMKEILLCLRDLSACVVVGGPLITCDESFFVGLCDVAFIGEAEHTWPQFIEDLVAGRKIKARYQQQERTDMSRVPKGRYDLIKASRYAVATVQFSRGCPYNCEFCDIIVMFGRRPRVKRPEQVIAELDDICDAGFKTCFIVDDNFIGNKRKAVAFLRELVAWQRHNGYPLVFSTEASINLADAPELLELMWQANFSRVFIGIESPNAESLRKAKKSQNLIGDSLYDKVRRIHEAGILVIGGFIVGFDEDTDVIFDSQYRFIQEAGIGLSSISILAPIPTTPLYDRLVAEGRLFPSDPVCAFAPKQLTREQVKLGCSELLRRVYEPSAFFARVFSVYHDSVSFRSRRDSIESLRSTGPVWKSNLVALLVVIRLFVTLQREGYLRKLAPAYLRAWSDNRTRYSDCMPFSNFVNICVQHWHFFKIAHSPQQSMYLEAANAT